MQMLIPLSFFPLLQAVPKLLDDDKTPAPPQFQENVFIESSRSKYLEDLHTEALEGLKMMQEEGMLHIGDSCYSKGCYL